MGRDENKLAKQERCQYPVTLIEQTWSIKNLLYGFQGSFSCGIQRVVPSEQDGSILSARVANHIARFGSSCPLTELANILTPSYKQVSNLSQLQKAELKVQCHLKTNRGELGLTVTANFYEQSLGRGPKKIRPVPAHGPYRKKVDCSRARD